MHFTQMPLHGMVQAVLPALVGTHFPLAVQVPATGWLPHRSVCTSVEQVMLGLEEQKPPAHWPTGQSDEPATLHAA